MFANRIVYLAVYQIYVCTKKFPPLVRPVPQRGTVCTLLWYDVYHSKVQDVPWWYSLYQPMEIELSYGRKSTVP